jgi:hypothetical protein
VAGAEADYLEIVRKQASADDEELKMPVDFYTSLKDTIKSRFVKPTQLPT